MPESYGYADPGNVPFDPGKIVEQLKPARGDLDTFLMMKRKSKPRGKFNMHLYRGPRVICQCACLRYRYDDVLAAGLVQTLLNFFRGWVDFAEAEYATLSAGASFGIDRSILPSSSTRACGCRPSTSDLLSA